MRFLTSRSFAAPPKGRPRMPCRCVANMPDKPPSSMASKTAPARAVPSRGLVPRPNSSTNTKLRSPQLLSILATSPISAPKADFPSVGTSADAPRTKRESNRRRYDSPLTGAARPQIESSAAAAVERMSVLFPLMLGAVSRYSPSRVKVLRTELVRSIQYGHTSSRCAAARVSSDPAAPALPRGDDGGDAVPSSTISAIFHPS
mmetsp:Transcript_12236/g.35885  ORF Transcript_12236/g.35885 Transcript_12236/m.35885 type:complete len:203 (-) Transcript_12236:1598-2206(-)